MVKGAATAAARRIACIYAIATAALPVAAMQQRHPRSQQTFGSTAAAVAAAAAAAAVAASTVTRITPFAVLGAGIKLEAEATLAEARAVLMRRPLQLRDSPSRGAEGEEFWGGLRQELQTARFELQPEVVRAVDERRRRRTRGVATAADGADVNAEPVRPGEREALLRRSDGGVAAGVRCGTPMRASPAADVAVEERDALQQHHAEAWERVVRRALARAPHVHTLQYTITYEGQDDLVPPLLQCAPAVRTLIVRPPGHCATALPVDTDGWPWPPALERLEVAALLLAPGTVLPDNLTHLRMSARVYPTADGRLALPPLPPNLQRLEITELRAFRNDHDQDGNASAGELCLPATLESLLIQVESGNRFGATLSVPLPPRLRQLHIGMEGWHQPLSAVLDGATSLEDLRPECFDSHDAQRITVLPPNLTSFVLEELWPGYELEDRGRGVWHSLVSALGPLASLTQMEIAVHWRVPPGLVLPLAPGLTRAVIWTTAATGTGRAPPLELAVPAGGLQQLRFLALNGAVLPKDTRLPASLRQLTIGPHCVGQTFCCGRAGMAVTVVPRTSRRYCGNRGWELFSTEAAQAWEVFTLEFVGRGLCNIRTAHGRYLCATPDGQIRGDAKNPHMWELFAVESFSTLASGGDSCAAAA
ncbi:hypothetical protein JKP88DRAFT_273284 [Tribonema minus]|uniref:Uncharacterized protein n=1 Tax=Tribonema minus TaxID=303371 RepID=A0A835YXD2_9STRA|nr:hypothetical protein JKP88DRAFT_273284 [Tribonema minus]